MQISRKIYVIRRKIEYNGHYLAINIIMSCNNMYVIYNCQTVAIIIYKLVPGHGFAGLISIETF